MKSAWRTILSVLCVGCVVAGCASAGPGRRTASSEDPLGDQVACFWRDSGDGIWISSTGSARVDFGAERRRVLLACEADAARRLIRWADEMMDMPESRQAVGDWNGAGKDIVVVTRRSGRQKTIWLDGSIADYNPWWGAVLEEVRLVASVDLGRALIWHERATERERVNNGQYEVCFFHLDHFIAARSRRDHIEWELVGMRFPYERPDGSEGVISISNYQHLDVLEAFGGLSEEWKSKFYDYLWAQETEGLAVTHLDSSTLVLTSKEVGWPFRQPGKRLDPNIVGALLSQSE